MSLAKLLAEIERDMEQALILKEKGNCAAGVRMYVKHVLPLLAIVRLQDEALGFYARRESWHIPYSEMITPYSDIKCTMNCDLEQLSSNDGTVHNKLGGKIAREARARADKLAAGGE